MAAAATTEPTTATSTSSRARLSAASASRRVRQPRPRRPRRLRRRRARWPRRRRERCPRLHKPGHRCRPRLRARRHARRRGLGSCDRPSCACCCARRRAHGSCGLRRAHRCVGRWRICHARRRHGHHHARQRARQPRCALCLPPAPGVWKGRLSASTGRRRLSEVAPPQAVRRATLDVLALLAERSRGDVDSIVALKTPLARRALVGRPTLLDSRALVGRSAVLARSAATALAVPSADASGAVQVHAAEVRQHCALGLQRGAQKRRELRVQRRLARDQVHTRRGAQPLELVAALAAHDAHHAPEATRAKLDGQLGACQVRAAIHV